MNEKIRQVWAASACVESLQAEMDQAQAALSCAMAEALAAGGSPESIGAVANLTLPELERRIHLLQTPPVPGIFG
ncbi:hypothetical protein LVY72_06095 [Arthrobacter sp. I2-34]|uniref:Uncharacterized protein n=1 Tax=Arthrobacter hankyongi TaxID=2904801 RepID=A0ABS9L4U1_9MICC|nr:hypothetical protein [Arthrobacter hankyongi]MCG2621487.1 hypothetical protein [Arthrobacter hankyongi]